MNISTTSKQESIDAPLSKNDTCDILVIEPELSTREIIKNLLEKKGYSVITASEIPDAMEKLIFFRPKILISEIMREGEQGIEIFRALRRIQSDSVIIIYTAQKNHKWDYEKRFGLIFEFLFKPTDDEIIYTTVVKALEFHKEKMSMSIYSSKDETWMKEQLEWMMWKEQRRLSSKSFFERTIIETIIHSIFQGMGVGGIVTMIEIMELAMKKEGTNYTIKAEIIDSIIKNAQSVRILRDRFDYILKIFNTDFPMQIIPGKEVGSFIEKGVQSCEKFRKIKNQELKIDNLNFTQPIYGNVDFIKLSVEELLTNAYKYSPEKSIINLTKYSYEDSSSIIVLNQIMPVTRGITGIPPEFENEIFSPFFKINNIYDERFYEENLGFGIGLTVLHTFINRLGGKLIVRETIDHVTSPKPIRKVMAELTLSVVKLH